MTFATFRTAARLAMAATSLAGLLVAAATPSRADGNWPHVTVHHEETILVPAPACSEYRPIVFGRCAREDVFATDCACAD